MVTSPFAPYKNSVLRFQVATGSLVADLNGNQRPGKAIIQVEALLEQRRDLSRTVEPGADPTAIYLEGFLVSPRPLPTPITPDSLCAATWQGRAGRFTYEFTARNPYLSALNIDLVERIRGQFMPGSFAVSGGEWVPGVSGSGVVEVYTATNGQTAFALPSQPSNPEIVMVSLNGLESEYGVDYTISGTGLSWINSGLPLVAGDKLQVRY